MSTSNPTNTPCLIEVEQLCKSYCDFWGRPRVEAVRNVSFRVARGEVLGLLGPNGSGKSTTIKLLLGLLKPSSGTIRLLGGSPSQSAVRSRLGYLPELSNLHPFLTPRETLEYYGLLFGMPAWERQKRIPELLELVGLSSKVADRQIGEFSKGMARRVGLAQALLNDPELIILDEPTSGLDPIGRHEVKMLIRSLRDRGKTVLLSSHLLSEVSDVCTRICIMCAGEFVAEGDLNSLLKSQNSVRFTVHCELPDAEQQRLVQLLASESGDGAVSIDYPALTLEDYFLRVMQEQAQKAQRTEA